MPRIIVAVNHFAAGDPQWALPYLFGFDPDDPELPSLCRIGRNPELVDVFVQAGSHTMVSRLHFVLSINKDGAFTFRNYSGNGTCLGLGENETLYQCQDEPVPFNPEVDVLTFGNEFTLAFKRTSNFTWSAAVVKLRQASRYHPSAEGDEKLARQQANLAQARKELAARQSEPAGQAQDNGGFPTYGTRSPEEG